MKDEFYLVTELTNSLLILDEKEISLRLNEIKSPLSYDLCDYNLNFIFYDLQYNLKLYVIIDYKNNSLDIDIYFNNIII
jgi:hypothetical protein